MVLCTGKSQMQRKFDEITFRLSKQKNGGNSSVKVHLGDLRFEDVNQIWLPRMAL